ncbi:MAG: DNA-binding protein WhiA [Clostridia bacterium]
MSFSQDIKDELLEQVTEKECCILAERYGELITTPESKKIDIVKIHRMLENKCCIASFMKGVFLGSGCVVDPNIEYHLELTLQEESKVEVVCRFMKKMKLRPKYIERANNYVIYVKESDQISRFLSYLQVSKALLLFEQIRVEKDVKNNINRYTNCETANIAKTAVTAVRHIDAINYLKKVKQFDNLPKPLKEIAELREKHEGDSLEELAEKYKGGISKSGINHRLTKIVTLAKKYKETGEI